MRKVLLASAVGLLSFTTLYAQKYGTTLGLRLGNGNYRTVGLTAEQRLLKHATLEGIVQSDFNRNTTAHALLKSHYPVLSKRLNLFAGAGVSLGNEESIDADPHTREVVTTYGNKTIGTDLILGAELTLLGFNASLDYKPNFNLTGRGDWYQGQVGISVRTVLIKDSQRKKNKRKREQEKRKKEREKSREAKKQ